MALVLEGRRARVAAPAARPAPADERLARVETAIVGVRIAVTISVAVTVAAGVPANVQAHPALIWALVAATAAYSVVVPLFPAWLLHRRGGSRLLNAVDAALSLAIIAVTGPAASPMVALLGLAIICTGMRFGLADALRAAVAEGAVFAALVFLVPEPPMAFPQRVQVAIWWPVYLLFAAVFTGALARIGEAEQAERLRAEARADQECRARRQAQEAWQQREELLRVVIHEFRTPVASVGALARHVAGACPSAQEEPGIRRALQLIQVHAEHLDDMVSALGDVARSGSTDDIDARVRASDVFLPELLRAAVAAGGGDDSTVSLEIDPDSTIARIDATRVRRIVINLVENALRHNTPGEPVEVRARIAGPDLEIVVADRGAGLSPADLDLAFRQYATFGERRGTSGLGLWIVDELTRRLGGSVEARPRDGSGLEVRVTLPVIPAAGPGPGRTSDSTAGGPGRNGGIPPAGSR
jgi:signal transduction histidine kinase